MPRAAQPGLHHIAAILLAGLALALGGLVVAFVVSFRLADRQYQLATLAEQQAGVVNQIASLAQDQPDAAELGKALRRYRGLILAETALLPADARQHLEAEDARRLESIAFKSSSSAAFRSLTERIARQEVGEVNAVHDELERLHTKTVVLAIALAAAALLCALGVAWLLLRRNRSLEAMVQARTAQLEEVDRSRRLFFAKASHELRTPVTAMRGEAEVALLGHAPQAEALRQSLSHIHASATFLGHRIDELLGLASANDGKLQLLRQKVELGALVKAAIEEATSFARSVEVNIELNEAGVPLFLEGDARWLRQALLTIIDNGLKFSPMGDVLTIALAASGDAARIIVTDNGPGVMPDDLPRIFDAYYQSEHGRQRGGNGLGLALARWVVEQHGGVIRASTRKEGGCCIMVMLPITITA